MRTTVSKHWLVTTIFILAWCSHMSMAQQPAIHIGYSRLYTTYQLAKKLSVYYPDNPYKDLIEKSRFNSEELKTHVARLDTLDLNESYEFQGYPYMQKIPGTTIALLERNLITSKDLEEFKIKSFGIIPNEPLSQLCETISFLLPVTDSVLYYPNQRRIDSQREEFTTYVGEANLGAFFAKAQNFYGAVWDAGIPIDVTIVPSPARRSFSAKAFLNNAAIELPLKYDSYGVVTGVLMHEVFHLLYDGQPKDLKLAIESWFAKHPSECSQYAYLLLNEALATALGNGYVYEQLNGAPDRGDWYDIRYINDMARKMYPLVKHYLNNNKTIDHNFVNSYIELYTEHFSHWIWELDHILANRYVLAEERSDFSFFTSHFPRFSSYQNSYPIDAANLDRLKQSKGTKIILVSKNREQQLKLIKESFEELSSWQYEADNEFVFTAWMEDKTQLIIVNKITGTVEQLFAKHFPGKKILHSK